MSSHNSEDEFESAESDSEEVPREVSVEEGAHLEDKEGKVENVPDVDRTTESMTVENSNVEEEDTEPQPEASCEATVEEEATVQSHVQNTKDDHESEDKTIIKDAPNTGQPLPSNVSDSKDSRSELPLQNSEDNGKDSGTQETNSSTTGGGGWGWGWGQSLWSTVGSAASKDPLGQLGQGISSVFHKVEEGLGIVSNAEEDTQEGACDGEGKGDGAGEGGRKKSDGDGKGGREKTEGVSEPFKRDETQEEQKSTEQTISEQPKVAEGTSSDPNTPKDAAVEETKGSFWSSFGIDITSITEVSKGLMTSGLDALENVGKKTMDILSDKDPESGKNRSIIFGGERATLSQLIQEAQDKSKEEEAARSKQTEGDEISLSAFLDEYQGLAHFEALELLSKESESKLRLLRTASKASPEEEEELEKLAVHFQTENENEDKSDAVDAREELSRLFAKFSLPVKVDKVVRTMERWREEAEKDSVVPSGESQDDESRATEVEVIFEHAMRSQGEVVSRSIELLRKTMELALLPTTEEVQSVEIAAKLQNFSELVGHELMSLTELFAEAFKKHKDSQSQSFATALFLEAGHSCSHVQEGFQLTRPILELRIVNQKKTADNAS